MRCRCPRLRPAPGRPVPHLRPAPRRHPREGGGYSPDALRSVLPRIFTIVGAIGGSRWCSYSSSAHPARHRSDDGDVWSRRRRAAGTVFQRHLPRGSSSARLLQLILTPTGAKATLSLNTSPKVPADLTATVLSVSAWVNSTWTCSPGPIRRLTCRWLGNGRARHDNSAGGRADARPGQYFGPKHPEDQTRLIARRVLPGLQASGYDLGSLLVSTATISADTNGVVDQTRTLTEDTGPLLDSQARTTDSIRTWARSLAGISDALVKDDSHFRTILQKRPWAATSVPASRPNQNDAAGVARQPDDHRADRHHLSPLVEQLLASLLSGVAIARAAAAEGYPEGTASRRLRTH